MADLPLVPQHDQRKSKNNPKNGAANVVHGKCDSDGEEEVRWRNHMPGVENTGFNGTGSCPPWHQG